MNTENLVPENSIFLARAAAVGELAELKRVADLLDRAGIRHLVIKGAAVAVSHYSSLHLRPHIDIDLWINPRDRARTQCLLEEQGYRTEEDSTPTELQRQFVMRKFVHAGLEVVLDIHLQLANADAFAELMEFEETWERGIMITADGVRFKTLCETDALILACIHPVMHHYSGDEAHLYQDIMVLYNRMSVAERERFYARTRELKISSLCRKSLEKAGGLTLNGGWLNLRLEPLALYPKLARGFWGQFAADVLLAPPSWFALKRLWRALFPPTAYMRRWAERESIHEAGLWSLYFKRLLGRPGKGRA